MNNFSEDVANQPLYVLVAMLKIYCSTLFYVRPYDVYEVWYRSMFSMFMNIMVWYINVPHCQHLPSGGKQR